MQWRPTTSLLLVAGAACVLGGAHRAAFAETPRDFTIRSDVRLVLLDVAVKDRDGGFVAGLGEEHFQVRENGVPQPITVFAANDQPVTVGILVDQSRSMTPRRAAAAAAAGTFIAESNRHDEVFVLHFNDAVQPGLRPPLLFSSDLRQLRTALDSGVPDGKTALYDAVIEGLRRLQLGRREKKALLVISDGGDTASRHKRGEMLERIERSIATIYTIGLFDPADPDWNPGVLRQMARLSGGDAYFPASPADLTEVCQGIAGDVRARYTIGFLPAAGGGPVRNLRVTASAPGRSRLTVRTRTRYRYDEDPSTP
jgi:Ca-activated chloride channel homolog